MTRCEILAPLIGEPWAWQSRNWWDFACHVQRELFGRDLPRVAVPADLSKRWVLESIERHRERAAWREVPDGPGGLITAADGALVLMAHLRFPAHIGVWLKPEARVIHCSEQHGVCCESVLALRQMGWKKLTFYEPIICYEKPQLRHSRRAIVEVRRREWPANLTNLQLRKLCFPSNAVFRLGRQW